MDRERVAMLFTAADGRRGSQRDSLRISRRGL